MLNRVLLQRGVRAAAMSLWLSPSPVLSSRHEPCGLLVAIRPSVCPSICLYICSVRAVAPRNHSSIVSLLWVHFAVSFLTEPYGCLPLTGPCSSRASGWFLFSSSRASSIRWHLGGSMMDFCSDGLCGLQCCSPAK